MGSLATNQRVPQLRCLVSGKAPLRYERKIAGHWVPCHYSRVAAIVEVMNRRGGAK